MLMICRSRTKERGAILILTTLLVMTIILPLAGLAIDLTILYIVQAKLWEAIDGAALEGGHLMGTTPQDIGKLAGQVCKANFPEGYWNAYNLQCVAKPSMPEAPDYMYKVAVTGSAQVPLLFMKVFQTTDASVSASAEASRRQARVVLVLDRSGSMAGSPLTTLKNAAASFVTKFNGGYDEMGFVVFGTSAVVGYPILNSGPYVFSPTDPNGGPNSAFKAKNGNNASGTICCDMIYAINKIGSGGATSMAEGLSLAFIELQKAHNISMSTNHYDVKRSVIVLFTDGVPNMLPVYLNSPDALNASMATDVPNYYVAGVRSPGNNLLLPSPNPYPSTLTKTANKSNCKFNYPSNLKTGTNTRGVTLADMGQKANMMVGVMGSGQAPSTSFTYNFALQQMLSLDTTHYTGGSGASAWSLKAVATDETFGTAITTGVTGCDSLGTSNATQNLNNIYTDLKTIPPWDLFGNLTTDLGVGHKASSASTFPKSTSVSFNNFNSMTTTGKGTQINIAAWNAVDNAANRIRNDLGTTSLATNPTIYAIGYSGTGGTDDVLLARVANDPNQSNYGATNAYNSDQMPGQYFPASDDNAIVDAFNKIGSILLNLSH